MTTMIAPGRCGKKRLVLKSRLSLLDGFLGLRGSSFKPLLVVVPLPRLVLLSELEALPPLVAWAQREVTKSSKFVT